VISVEMRSPKVTVLGGGQLGRMLGLAGIPLGISFRFLDPGDEPSAAVAGPVVRGALSDLDAAARAAEGATVVTYEWEGVPSATARHLAATVPVFPPPSALDVSQDRLAEKETCRSLGIATAEFRPVDSREDLADAVRALGLPLVVKTRRGGYDGKGQYVVRDDADVARAWAALGGQPLIAESWVPFARELSVLGVRSREGTVACWPVVQNEHEGGILRRSQAPAPGVDRALQARAEACLVPLLETFAYVGVCCVELFDVGGELLVNEIAPRVHNSGHWTIEGAETSQFENHVRAVLGWPLGSTAARGVSAMINCIGEMPDREHILSVPGAHVHDYGKTARAGRKLGHVTVTAPDAATLDARLGLLPHLSEAEMSTAP
jgi:5-(carboxyamino)imidazole ribonucleotide synthase